MTTIAHSFHWARNSDGTRSGEYPAGDKPPLATLLSWSGCNAGLQTAGISDLRVGTAFSHDVRQYLSGTAAAAAAITIISPNGDNPTTSGFSVSGDNLLYDGAASASGSFQLRATNGADIANTANIAWQATESVAAERTVYFVASFESGQMLDRATSPLLDSAYYRSHTEPYGDPTHPTSVGYGKASLVGSGAGLGPTSPMDVRVVTTDTEPTVAGVSGIAVVSRTGASGKFLRGLITHLKDYRDDQDTTSYGGFYFGKPRWTMTFGGIHGTTGWYVNDPDYQFPSDHSGWAVDKTVWLAFSMYIPSNYQPDRGMKYQGHRENNPFDILCNNGSASNSLMSLRESVPDPRLTSPCLMLCHYHVCDWSVWDNKNPDGTKNPDATLVEVKLFDIMTMRGKWVDFIIRFRENPFTVTRNPATGVGGSIISQAINHTFAANTGVLQMWWGAAGTVFDPALPTQTYASFVDRNGVTQNRINITGGPVGLVPMAEVGRNFSVRQYKANWLKNLGSPAGPAMPNDPDPAKSGAWAAHDPTPTHTPPASTLTDPMYKAFDEIRWGYEQMGTGLTDVAPG